MAVELVDMVYAFNKAIYLIILFSVAPIAIATFYWITCLLGYCKTIIQIQRANFTFWCQACGGLFVYFDDIFMGDKLPIYAKERC